MAVQMQAPDGRVVAVDTPVLVNQLKAQGYTVVTEPRPAPESEPVVELVVEPVVETPVEVPAEQPEGQFHSYVVAEGIGGVDNA